MSEYEQSEEDKIEAWKEAFEMFDNNHDGHIDLKELGKVIRSLGQNPSDKELKHLIDCAEKNSKKRDGRLQFDEFVILMRESYKPRCKSEIDEDLMNAFRIFDKNGDGVIQTEELMAVVTALGDKLTEEEANELLNALDHNKDGKVKYEDFVKFANRPVLSSQTLGPQKSKK